MQRNHLWYIGRVYIASVPYKAVHIWAKLNTCIKMNAHTCDVRTCSCPTNIFLKKVDEGRRGGGREGGRNKEDS